MMKTTKALLLACAFLLTAAAATRPAQSDACFLFGMCKACTTPTPTAQPCTVVICGTHRTENCGSCVTNCVPPPD
ncbi:MAG TPA: hypothetical protein VF173_23065 [Thermoanaerobaculia bacterium]|nr:hypothetical protein [Thermoanaerobaculia bacterium]